MATRRFLSAVSFILSRGPLVTVRYCDPRSFSIIATRLQKMSPEGVRGDTVLVALLDTIIGRAADLLEAAGQDIDASPRAFSSATAPAATIAPFSPMWGGRRG